jgi:SAM-dependent methyltransferase
MEGVYQPHLPAAAARPLYALTIFLNAFLLFAVQPLIGKAILPWFGGVAAVWTVCLLFFQVALLLGYYYAHLLSRRCPPRLQGRVHAALLALSLLVLPILPRDTWKPTGSAHPALSILLLLSCTIGLPYFLLSSTSPLLQAWYAQSRPGAAPYRFYALSNAGSMLALLSYPLLIEPRLSTSHQGAGWSLAYAAAALLCACVALTAHRSAYVQPPLAASDVAPDGRTKALWMALAGCASLLLLGITTHVTQNVASVPLLWIIPLALYLLSFILCFDGRRWYRRALFLRLLGLALASMAYALSPSVAPLPLSLQIGLFCGGLFICCMFCHGELVRLKPDPAHLTSFYLLIALGSAIGAVFAALVAPIVFNGYYELPVALGFCALLVPVLHRRDPATGPFRWVVLLALACGLAACLVGVTVVQAPPRRVMVRNFYGVLSVIDQLAPGQHRLSGQTSAAALENQRSRRLMNGAIDHGLQFLAASRRREPTTYYGPDSGVGIALRSANRGHPGPLRVGLVGLGAGTLATYGRPLDRYTFYEINPLDVALARTEFTFLGDSPAAVDIVLGDARLSLERQPGQAFDVLAVDAFSGDSIPVHLLTLQAFELYFRQLQPGGVLAVHVSNHYLDLRPVVQAAAARLNKEAVCIDSRPGHDNGVFRATWVLLGSRDGFLARDEIRQAGQLLAPPLHPQLWTDDFSSLFPLLM